MIPEPLILDTPEIYNCPKCNAPIADWVVTNNFECPSCNKKLSSNKRLAIKKAAIFSAVLFVILLVLSKVLIHIFSFSEGIEFILYIVPAIIPGLTYYFGFKLLFKLHTKNDK
ncbi:hypothetical protein [uncultured Cocleimonas sp.]|uniref:hypothetical protein n=1 Tax=uncultured Cocleimonas sp. TaxID=1051587 RepID=UPI002621107C|nr:hypothetical protein [uncultured Cocleimonas sp.]